MATIKSQEDSYHTIHDITLDIHWEKAHYPEDDPQYECSVTLTCIVESLALRLFFCDPFVGQLLCNREFGANRGCKLYTIVVQY
jgi:hypothetical protein